VLVEQKGKTTGESVTITRPARRDVFAVDHHVRRSFVVDAIAVTAAVLAPRILSASTERCDSPRAVSQSAK
jgi:hypothetical protein